MLCYVMLCYVMLCYVMLCYVMLCYVMLCYVMLCYVMLCQVMLCSVMLCNVMSYRLILCWVTLHHITSHHITSHHITSHHVTSHHITSRHITSYHITSHHITSRHITSHHITSHHITLLIRIIKSKSLYFYPYLYLFSFHPFATAFFTLTPLLPLYLLFSLLHPVLLLLLYTFTLIIHLCTLEMGMNFTPQEMRTLALTFQTSNTKGQTGDIDWISFLDFFNSVLHVSDWRLFYRSYRIWIGWSFFRWLGLPCDCFWCYGI